MRPVPHALGVAAWCAAPLLPALDTAAALARGWRPHGAIEHLGAAAAALAAAAAAAAVLLPRSRAAMTRRGPEALLALAAMAAAAALVEAGAAIAAARLAPAVPFHTRGPLLRQTIHPDPAHIAGIAGAARFHTDARGIRSAAPPPAGRAYDVLCIGGSAAECVYLDDAETWPALLAAAWPRPPGAPAPYVGNAGISGFDTRDHLRFVRESKALDGVRDLVVMCGINDLWRYLAQEETHTRFDRFAPPGAGALAPAATPPAPPCWARARTIALWHRLRRAPPAPRMAEGVGGAEYAIRREARARAAPAASLPDLGPGLAGYRARIEALIDAAQARGLRIAFVTQPVLWAEGLEPAAAARCWFGWLPDGRYLALPALREAMEAYNAALQAVCAARGVPCCDLGALDGRPALFYDDCHFTEAGARAAAEAIAACMAAPQDAAGATRNSASTGR